MRSIFVSITGNGLKTLEAQAGRLPPVPVIEARLEAFAEVVGRLAPARRQETKVQ